MATNLFIAYDLNSPGQNYDQIRDAIRGLGQYHQFQYSLFYVSTRQSPQQAYAIVSQFMDANDRLAVIEANSAIVTNWDKPLIDAINTVWFTP